MIPPLRVLTAASFTAALAGTLTTARSLPIQQGAADTFIAFEAEANGVITNGPPATSNQFMDFADGTASGGAALFQSFPSNPNFNEGGADGTTAKSFDAYTLNFVNAGSYTFYYTLRSQADLGLDAFSGNSFFFSSSFGSPVNARSEASNAASNVTTYTLFNEATLFTVAAPGVYTFTLGDREASTTIDRFIFSSTPIADKAAFDAIPNSIPEPASIGLLALALAGLATRRSRRSS